MLKQVKRKREEGFTIIEVLIVLAIAALILVIVFLAVPALQRSSRNTQRKNDAANVLSAVSDYVSNNSGQPPAACSSTAGAFSGSGDCKFLQDVKLGYYNASNATIKVVTSVPGSAPDTNTVDIITGAQCGTTAADNPTSSTNNRQYVAWYGIEGSTGAQCVEG
ncbi:MAG TPA: type II secretion system protein [Candidatus Saccharimonadales bacterium]